MNTEVEVPVKLVMIKMLCLKDDPHDIEQGRCSGEMKPIDKVSFFPVFPTKYPHQCTVCKREDMFLKSYPAIEYRTIT